MLTLAFSDFISSQMFANLLISFDKRIIVLYDSSYGEGSKTKFNGGCGTQNSFVKLTFLYLPFSYINIQYIKLTAILVSNLEGLKSVTLSCTLLLNESLPNLFKMFFLFIAA